MRSPVSYPKELRSLAESKKSGLITVDFVTKLGNRCTIQGLATSGDLSKATEFMTALLKRQRRRRTVVRKEQRK